MSFYSLLAAALLAGAMALGMDSAAHQLKSFAGRSPPQANYLEQRQDHFDANNNNTWRQAYYVNDTFWQPGSQAPVFLCVGGEGPRLDGSAVFGSVHCNVAVEWLQEKKALMFALEHRYYGCQNLSACPTPSFAKPAEGLRFLSSRQAVEDIAGFVRAMNDRFGLKSQWVTWGGSYPGMLAAWSRLKHPELISVAVASSAPVYAKFDMPEYLDHVAFAYTVSDNGVGGSVACRDAIRAGHAWIEGKFKEDAEGQAEVELKFGLDAGFLSSSTARSDFASAGVADFPAQSNDPLCEDPGCNIAKVCAIMLNETYGTPVDRLASLRTIQRQQPSSQRARVRSSSNDKQLELPDFWYYQTCTEFGFYQTCETNSTCMFVQGLGSAADQAHHCADWGISEQDVMVAINETNKHYGGLLPTDESGQLGSCVLWPNGEVDPWSPLSSRCALSTSASALRSWCIAPLMDLAFQTGRPGVCRGRQTSDSEPRRSAAHES